MLEVSAGNAKPGVGAGFGEGDKPAGAGVGAPASCAGFHRVSAGPALQFASAAGADTRPLTPVDDLQRPVIA